MKKVKFDPEEEFGGLSFLVEWTHRVLYKILGTPIEDMASEDGIRIFKEKWRTLSQQIKDFLLNKLHFALHNRDGDLLIPEDSHNLLKIFAKDMIDSFPDKIDYDRLKKYDENNESVFRYYIKLISALLSSYGRNNQRDWVSKYIETVSDLANERQKVINYNYGSLKRLEETEDTLDEITRRLFPREKFEELLSKLMSVALNEKNIQEFACTPAELSMLERDRLSVYRDEGHSCHLCHDPYAGQMARDFDDMVSETISTAKPELENSIKREVERIYGKA